jgi:hypothetical protein
LSWPLGVFTVTDPLVAPEGTVALISDSDSTSNDAAVPLKLTALAPVRLVPRILTTDPTLPELVCVATNGPRPVESLNTVPRLLAPPDSVVP